MNDGTRVSIMMNDKELSLSGKVNSNSSVLIKEIPPAKNVDNCLRVIIKSVKDKYDSNSIRFAFLSKDKSNYVDFIQENADYVINKKSDTSCKDIEHDIDIIYSIHRGRLMVYDNLGVKGIKEYNQHHSSIGSHYRLIVFIDGLDDTGLEYPILGSDKDTGIILVFSKVPFKFEVDNISSLINS